MKDSVLVIIRFFILTFAVNMAIPAAADESPEPPRRKVGLALSGGGARGAAHIGVLKVLERENIPIDYIAGTSFGALVGGLYAIGYSPDEIENFLVTQDWNSFFSDVPQWNLTPLTERADSRYQGKIALRGWNLEIPGGLLKGQRFAEGLDVLTTMPMLRAWNEFDKLPIPFRAIATNLVNGEPYVFRNGSMTQALRASIAVPMIFTPIEIEGALLVDGGLVDNLPTGVVRDMGADIIIAVDVSTPLFARDDLGTLLNVIDQSISLQIAKNVEESKKLASIVLIPHLDSYSNTNYDKTMEMAKLGAEAAELFIDEITALVAGITPRVSRPDIAAQTKISVIDAISFSGLNRVQIKQIENVLSLHPGDEAEPVALDTQVRRLYATRFFESVSYTLSPAGENRCHLIFYVREDLFHTLGAGIRFDNDYGFTILAEYTARHLFGTPSRVVASSQFGGLEHHSASFRFVPFPAELFFIEPKVEISRQKRLNRDDDARTYGFTDKREGGSFMLGGTFFRQVEFSAGYRLERIRIFDAPEQYARQGTSYLAGFSARLYWDSLDSPDYPRRGRRLNAQFEKRNKAFGSDSNNMKGTMAYRRYIPLSDRATLQMDITVGYSQGDVPFYDLFFIGGNSRSSFASEPFSGFGADTITVRQMAIAGFKYYHRVVSRPLSILKQGYLTATYNGGVFSEHSVSPYELRNLNGLGIGMEFDTRIGPFQTAFGWGEGGHVNYYMSFGPSF